MMGFLARFRRPGGISCAHVQDLVQGYLDGELSDPDRQRLTQHLDRCQACGIEAETYQEIKRALSAPPPPEAVDRLTRYAATLSAEKTD